jgi:hypothetical protein
MAFFFFSESRCLSKCCVLANLIGKPPRPAFRKDARPHRPRVRFCYPFHQLPQLVVLTQAGAERADRSRSPCRDPSVVIHLSQPPYNIRHVHT